MKQTLTKTNEKYLNPPCDKELWLKANGDFVLETDDFSNIILYEAKKMEEDKRFVCLVDNFWYSAAVVADTMKIVKGFNDMRGKKKKWYKVEVDKLAKYV